jgi:hypothetical protein
MRVSAILAGALAAALSGAVMAVAAAPEGWKTYTNHVLGYSISYPGDWRVVVDYVYPGFGPDHPIKGVAFEIPSTISARTNLSPHLTNVSVESREGRGPCDARRFIPDPADMHDVAEFGRTWSVATQQDAGAGNRYDIKVFVVKNSSPCLAVRYFIHFMAFENYTPGSVRRFDRAALIRQFDAVRKTLITGPH